MSISSPFDTDVDATVLRQAFFGNVHAAHHLNARMIVLGNRFNCAGSGMRCRMPSMRFADAQFVFLWFEMDVRRTVLERFPDDLLTNLMTLASWSPPR